MKQVRLLSLSFLVPLVMVFAVALSASLVKADEKAKAQAALGEKFVYLDTKYGRTIIRLRPDLAPNHVKRIKKLVREGFYDGLKFHRVIDRFMAQTGDPTGTGTSGSKYPDLKAEFSRAPFNRGTVGMARANYPHSANSQFFICFEAAPFLNGKYTVIGEVVDGMKYINKIKRGAPGSGMVQNPDVIKSMMVAADEPGKSLKSLQRFEPAKGGGPKPGRGVLIK